MNILKIITGFGLGIIFGVLLITIISLTLYLIF